MTFRATFNVEDWAENFLNRSPEYSLIRKYSRYLDPNQIQLFNEVATFAIAELHRIECEFIAWKSEIVDRIKAGEVVLQGEEDAKDEMGAAETRAILDRQKADLEEGEQAFKRISISPMVQKAEAYFNAALERSMGEHDDDAWPTVQDDVGWNFIAYMREIEGWAHMPMPPLEAVPPPLPVPEVHVADTDEDEEVPPTDPDDDSDSDYQPMDSQDSDLDASPLLPLAPVPPVPPLALPAVHPMPFPVQPVNSFSKDLYNARRRLIHRTNKTIIENGMTKLNMISTAMYLSRNARFPSYVEEQSLHATLYRLKERIEDEVQQRYPRKTHNVNLNCLLIFLTCDAHRASLACFSRWWTTCFAGGGRRIPR